MERTFSKELEEAVEKYASANKIIIVLAKIMSNSVFLKVEEKNKFKSPTVCYILPDGTILKKLSEKDRESLPEYAAIVDIENEFFVAIFIYNN